MNNPAADIFDGRTNYMSTRGDVTVELSPRLSVDLGLEAQSQAQVRINPVIAAITGQTEGFIATHRVN